MQAQHQYALKHIFKKIDFELIQKIEYYVPSTGHQNCLDKNPCDISIVALTLGLGNTYIYILQAFLSFCNFSATSCGFWKLANQYSEITVFCFETSNGRARSKG